MKKTSFNYKANRKTQLARMSTLVVIITVGDIVFFPETCTHDFVVVESVFIYVIGNILRNLIADCFIFVSQFVFGIVRDLFLKWGFC